MRVALIYFSPTGSTAKIASIIKDVLTELEARVEEYDITSYSDRQNNINFLNHDSVFFGFPIYIHRAPEIIRDWIQTLDGSGKRCSVFFTYGGVTTGVAHHDIKKRLEGQNFQLVSTAEFLAKHTYNIAGWKLMENRPNEKDFSIARDYALKTWEKFKSPVVQAVEFEEPAITEKKLDRLDKVPKRAVKPPSREGRECSMCLKCGTECPNNAMDPNSGNADGDKCIRCLRCVAFCPDNALKTNDMTPAYEVIVKRENTPEILESKVSKYFV